MERVPDDWQEDLRQHLSTDHWWQVSRQQLQVLDMNIFSTCVLLTNFLIPGSQQTGHCRTPVRPSSSTCQTCTGRTTPIPHTGNGIRYMFEEMYRSLASGEVHLSHLQGPSGALDLHDLRDCDQREATKLKLGPTSADQLAEDQLGFQSDDEFPQRLRCGRQTWLRWEEASTTYGGSGEGGLQPRAEARLFPVYLPGTYRVLTQYLSGTYRILIRYLLGTYQVLIVYLSGTFQVLTQYTYQAFAKGEAGQAPIAWFVSHCKAHSGRDKYINWLSKWIGVDIYGRWPK